MMRLIDADEFRKRIDHYPQDIRDIAKKELRYCKTIEAEPIIRCKDCHYAKPYNKIWQLPKRDTLVCTHFANDEVDNNFFCGYAIKKMDEVNDEN